MKNKGFTLIELMIVMAIIGLIASLAIPGYQSYRVKAHNTVAIAEVHLIGLMEMSFYNDTFSYADYLNTERTATGSLNKTFTINGTNYSFSLPNLNTNIDSMVKVDATGQFPIIAARNIRGDVIIAVELDQGERVMKKISATLTSADLPPSTSSLDLTGLWNPW